MKTVETIGSIKAAVKAARRDGCTIALVPTMGALHRGHISLIEAAKKQADFVVVSVFVNPAQFGPGEDLEKYPRDLAGDTETCQKAGTDVIFAPLVKEMYPVQQASWVSVDGLGERLCGKFRPGHFKGVATVCAKLFGMVGPDLVFFGQKDAQQAVIIRRMVADLNIPVKIVVCPTVRDKDGLALSSRNSYLTAQQKKDAAYIYRSLQKCRQLIEEGIYPVGVIIEQAKAVLGKAPSIKVEYINIVDAETLDDIHKPQGKILVAVAVRIGTTRLIDNIILDMTAK